MSEPYHSKFFAGRKDQLKAIRVWVATYASHRSRRIMSVAGPPGIGKSWVVAQIYEEMVAAKQLMFVLNLSATQLLSGQPAFPDFIRGPTNLQNDKAYLQWLKTAIQEVKKLCPKMEESKDFTLLPATILEMLVEQLCLDCAKPPPVLIVDGYEELTEEQGRWLQDNFLQPFLARSCTLLIITRRDKEWPNVSPKLKTSTSVDTLFLEPFSTQEGKDQIQKRLRNKTLVVTDDAVREAVYASIPGYQQTYPKLNSILMDLALEKEKAGQPGTLTPQDLKDCLEKIVHPVKISAGAVSNLSRMAKVLPAEFSYHEFQKQLQITLDDVQELFELGLLLDGVSTYKIPEGVYELAKAM